LLFELRRDLLLGLDVQRVALLLGFTERDQGVLRRSDLSSSSGAQAVEHTEVKRANEPKVCPWHLDFSSLDTIGELGSRASPGVELVPTV
jgi:hypothetical protein